VRINAYELKVSQEDMIYKWMRRSDYTAKKADADRHRDASYTGLTGMVRANMRSLDPDVRDKAVHLDNLLRNYGDVTHMGYDAETGALDSILAYLQGVHYNPAVTALGLMPWVNDLQARNDLFKTFVEDTTEERLEKPEINPKTARRETDLALRAITNNVTAMIQLEDPTRFEPFIREFNDLVNHYNTLVHEHYGRIHVRTDLSPADVDTIPDQPWTGKPINVIPTVTLRICEKDGTEKTVEPVFSRDFTVAYDGNIGPGTATIYIRGIGTYVGERTVTFNIIRV
jgi:hypothetical protein